MPTYGRGGAGNIQTATQVVEENKRISDDLEAARPTANPASAVHPSSQSQPQTQNEQNHFAGQQSYQPPAAYAHSGRGGAGNWYSPSQLQATGQFTSHQNPTSSADLPPATSPPTLSPSSTPKSTSPPPDPALPIGKLGRGGMGNFKWQSAQDYREYAAERRREEEKVLKESERRVSDSLTRPGRAWIGEGRGRLEDEGEREGWRAFA
ncbi:hypothetical protein M501DRAFT_989475 [Patellaria atrata CBS 101060]|uniref:Uncharacterized protein n=1 Tax=Patellaria atrata CBS 101060 TaxID=1346257 RepID=A0A9P4S233_9PEZI|nr:hypothetical protein M501DRAFT_989475 [Patellaria atrata CBS 101060]